MPEIDYILLFDQPGTETWSLIIYAILVVLLVAGMLILSWILGTKHEARHTHEPYESGIKVTGDARLRFPSQYYIVAMFFVIFDLEVVFLVAWAISFDLTGWLGYTGAMVFIGILVAVLIYEWRIGALDYGLKGKELIKVYKKRKDIQ